MSPRGTGAAGAAPRASRAEGAGITRYSAPSEISFSRSLRAASTSSSTAGPAPSSSGTRVRPGRERIEAQQLCRPSGRDGEACPVGHDLAERLAERIPQALRLLVDHSLPEQLRSSSAVAPCAWAPGASASSTAPSNASLATARLWRSSTGWAAVRGQPLACVARRRAAATRPPRDPPRRRRPGRAHRG